MSPPCEPVLALEPSEDAVMVVPAESVEATLDPCVDKVVPVLVETLGQKIPNAGTGSPLAVSASQSEMEIGNLSKPASLMARSRRFDDKEGKKSTFEASFPPPFPPPLVVSSSS